MSKLTDAADALSKVARQLPIATRKRLYRWTKVLAGLATLVLLVLPLLPTLGVNWSESGVVITVLTGLLTFLGHVADSNTAP
jgi:uncharacterized membrane protein